MWSNAAEIYVKKRMIGRIVKWFSSFGTCIYVINVPLRWFYLIVCPHATENLFRILIITKRLCLNVDIISMKIYYGLKLQLYIPYMIDSNNDTHNSYTLIKILSDMIRISKVKIYSLTLPVCIIEELFTLRTYQQPTQNFF